MAVTMVGMNACKSLPLPLYALLNLMVVLIWPCQAALSGLGSLYFTTTVEQQDPLTLGFRRLTLGPLYALLFLITLPVALIAIVVRCLLCLLRKPYEYSVCLKDHTTSEEELMTELLSGPGLKNHRFGIASANLCLLPEFLARINNLSHAGKRAKSVGERIVVDQFFYGGVPKSIVGSPQANGNKNHVDDFLTGGNKDGFVGGVSAHFPRVDFLCLQEVFDWNYNKTLREELHKVFPYVVHDVGVTSLSCNYFCINSGLLLASRHPVLAAHFRFYSNRIAQCAFIGKGLLMVKVQIGKETESRRQVGYIFTTHLQAYQGTEPVIVKQMDDILKWTSEFRQQTLDSKDVVLFDVLCGDFNIDNISPGDQQSREHNLFGVYNDPCRAKAGQDHPWAVGTEFKQIFMHESMATTPDGLKACLSDPVLRHRYLVDADIMEQSMNSLVHVKLRTDRHGNITPFPEAGRRRIDYIMHRKDQPLTVSQFLFVTRLASLTDHIPVAMTFKVKA